MATITEVGVRVRVEITVEETQAKIVAVGESYDASGETIRRVQRNITDQLSAARRQAAADLVADVETRLKQLWNIT